MRNAVLICITCLGVTLVTSASIHKIPSLYDAVAEKCPQVITIPDFNKQPQFGACTDWHQINSQKELTESSKKDLLCKLYYTNFVLYCTSNVTLNTTLPGNMITVDTICSDVTLMSTQIPAVKSPEDCRELCSNIGYAESICIISHHFGRLAIEAGSLKTVKTPPQSLAVKPQEVVSIQTASENHSHHVETGQSAKAPSEPVGAPEVVDKHNGIMKPPVAEETSVNSPSDPEVPSAQAEGPNAQAAVHVDPADGDTALAPNAQPNVQNAPDVVKNVKPLKDVVGLGTPNEGRSETAVEQKPKTDQVSAASEHNPPSSNNVGLQAALETRPQKVEKDKSGSDNAPTGNQNQPPSEVKPDNVEAPPVKIDSKKIGDESEFGEQEDDTQDDEEEMNDNAANRQENVNQQQTNDEDDAEDESPKRPVAAVEVAKPEKTDESDVPISSEEIDSDSYFFSYFMLLCIMFIVGYVCYHNKQKILALILEGRRGKRQYRGRRPNSANYHKLDSNLEEAISSTCSKNASNVIY